MVKIVGSATGALREARVAGATPPVSQALPLGPSPPPSTLIHAQGAAEPARPKLAPPAASTPVRFVPAHRFLEHGGAGAPALSDDVAVGVTARDVELGPPPGASSRVAVESRTFAVGSIPYSREQLRAAMSTAFAAVERFVRVRSGSLTSRTVFGPSLDGTYYFRLGEHRDSVHKADVRGFDVRTLATQRGRWLSRELPVPSREELYALQLVNLSARVAARPDVLWVAKHYPGGNHLLEVTEARRVSFSGVPEAVAGWLDPWRDLLAMPSPPKAIMFAHAEYPPAPFGLPEGTRVHSRFLDTSFAFSELPASLNALLVAHLRGERGYRGLVIGDWYDMRAVVQFAEAVALDPPAGYLHVPVVTMLLALEADVDVVPGVSVAGSAGLARYIEQRHDRAEIEEALTTSLQHTSARLRTAGLPSPADSVIAALSLKDKLQLKQGREVEGLATGGFAQLTEGKDAWNRQGVLTLLLRAKLVEALTGEALGAGPRDIADEEAWVARLQLNQSFTRVSSQLDWHSQAMRELFAEQARVAADALSAGGSSRQ